jgi:tetratricopeptide (TPR) repeat protein
MAENYDELSDAELWKLTTSDDKKDRAEALMELSWRLYQQRDFSESLSAVATARALFIELEMPSSEARAGLIESRGLIAREDYSEAISLLERTIELYRTYASEAELADAISLQAQAYACVEDGEKAEKHFRAALELYRSNNRPTSAGIIALDLGDLLGGMSRQSEALVTFHDALAIFQGGSDLVGSGRAHDRIAAALIDLGDIDVALDHLREALRIFEYIEDAPRWTWAQYRLGWTLVTKGQNAEAIPLLKEAARWYKEQGNYSRAADADTQLAHALTNEGNEIEAREIYRRTRAVYAGLGQEHSARIADGNIAASLARTGEVEEAVELYRRLLAQSRETEDGYLIRGISVRLANSLRDLGTFAAYEEAIAILDASPVEDWGDSIGDKVFQLDAYRGTYLDMANEAKAEEYANKILEYGVEPGFMGYTANAYRTIGILEHDRGNSELSKSYIAQAIALYLADGSDGTARELSQRLMPTGSPAQGTDILRPESTAADGNSIAGQPELDFGGE